MSKKKIIIIVLIAVAVILGALFIYNKNKVDIVINSVGDMLQVYSSKNAYIKETNNNGNYTEIYKLNDIEKNIQYNKENGIKNTNIVVNNKTIKYMENDDGSKKVMTIAQTKNEDIKTKEENININFFESIFNKTWNVFGVIDMKISSEVVDGKECYVVKSKNLINENGKKKLEILYIDKKKNLPIKYISDKDTITYEYSIGTIKNSDVAELNLSEYKLLTEEEFTDYEM